MSGALKGVRILDMTRVLNGPYCTMLLGHLGAEVIKVEPREGDYFRHIWMPPDVKRDVHEFLIVNTNKKSITLNLKTERGRELCLRLVKMSDVLVENFSLGASKRLGLDYEKLRAVNPHLIYAFSRGYGDSGPNASFKSNASTNNAVTGWQYSAWETSGHYGTKVLGVGDEAAGVSLALGIIAALYAREKTGLGQKVEVSMQEALLGFMCATLHSYFEGVLAMIDPIEVADGYYAFRSPDMDDNLWSRLCKVMNKEELQEDSRFSSRQARRNNRKALDEIISEWMRGKTRHELWRTWSELGLPSAPVLTMDEVIKDPHLESRGAFIKKEHPVAGTLTLLAPWIRMSETPASINSTAPLLGQHNEEVYCGLLGISREELESLGREKVI